MDDRDSDLENYTFPETITVKELIEKLKEYPPDMKVCTTWESTINTLLAENIYLSKWDVVFIDADGNFYKNEYEKK